MQNIAWDLVEVSGLDFETCEQIVAFFKEQCILLTQDLRINVDLQSSMEVASLLHKLKGSSGNVCATNIAELAALAELANAQKDQAKLYYLIDLIEQEIDSISG